MSTLPLIWAEISSGALGHNLAQFRRLAGEGVRVCPVVKSNAYGHGLILVAGVLGKAGADAFAVNSLWEAVALRRAGIELPILTLGHVPLDGLEEAVGLGLDLTIYNQESLAPVSRAAVKLGSVARLHIKLETGTHRQGVMAEDLPDLARTIASLPGIELTGLSTHYANIEDTTEHSYARLQLERYEIALTQLAREGLEPACKHTACTAAAILFPKTYFNMLRVGIGTYGLWPSKETLVSATMLHRKLPVELRPVLKWKTRIVQIKQIPAGAHVGYGCSYKTTRPTLMAVLPIGYFDGYDRKLSGGSFVLIRGYRAPVLGRVCMNLTMIDVTDLPDARLEEEVILLGADNGDGISAEDMAAWAGTINYEIVTRIGAHVDRILVD